MDESLAPLVMSDTLKRRIRDAAAKPMTAAADDMPLRRKKPVRFKRIVMSVAAACLVLVFSISVAAGAFPAFEHFITRMGEDLRTLVQPINLVSTQNGIRMDVLAAVNDGEMATVYLALTDEEGTRIDPGTELYDLSIPETHLSWGHMVDYDTESGSAIFRLEGDGKQLLGGQKLTVTLNSITTGNTFYEKLDVGLGLADVAARWPLPALAGTNGIDEDGWATGSFSLQYGEDPAAAEALSSTFDKGELPLLQPFDTTLSAGEADWLEIESIGLVDGFLHVRYCPATEAGRYARSEFFLSWADGPQSLYDSTLARAEMGLGERAEVGRHLLYDAYEQILELPQGVPLEEISLCVGGSAPAAYIEGGWSTTFTLDESPPQLVAEMNLDLGGWSVNQVVISSIGVAAYGQGEQNEHSEGVWMEVYLKDGSVVESISGYGFSDYVSGLQITRDSFSRPIDIDAVERLLVNGEEVPFTKVE